VRAGDNTSSLSVTAMTSGLAHPERVVAFHFFNPVAVRAVEVGPRLVTDDAAVATPSPSAGSSRRTA